MYVDESYDSKGRYIVLAGFIIPLDRWHEIDYAVKHLKQEFFLYRYVNLKHIRRQKYDDNELWKKLTDERKDAFNEKLWNIISAPENTAMVAVIDSQKMEKKDKELLFRLPYGFLLQRYEYYLSSKGSTGIVIMDKADNSPEIKDLYHTHSEFLRRGIPVERLPEPPSRGNMRRLLKRYRYGTLSHVCEGLAFMDDDDSNMLQLADFVASAVSSKYNRNIDKWYNRLLPILRKSKDGKVEGYGLKVFPT